MNRVNTNDIGEQISEWFGTIKDHGEITDIVVAKASAYQTLLFLGILQRLDDISAKIDKIANP